MENLFNSGLFYGLALASNDVINMSIVKNISIGILAQYWLYFAYFLYGLQMIIFYKGVQVTGMSVLNLIWNLISNIVITMIGLFYFKENITHLEKWGILFALFALFLFELSQYHSN
jgi:multidrug transporter EmrE-like cation transporter